MWRNQENFLLSVHYILNSIIIAKDVSVAISIFFYKFNILNLFTDTVFLNSCIIAFKFDELCIILVCRDFTY